MSLIQAAGIGLDRIEFLVEDERLSQPIAPVMRNNAFQLMMRQPCNFLPQKNAKPKDGRAELGNHILDYLRERNACFNASENNDGTAVKVHSELLTVFWYLNGQDKKFENAAGVTSLVKKLVFPTFRAKGHHKMPPIKREELDKMHDKLAKLFSQDGRVQSTAWNQVRQELSSVHNSMVQYSDHLAHALVDQQTRIERESLH